MTEKERGFDSFARAVWGKSKGYNTLAEAKAGGHE